MAAAVSKSKDKKSMASQDASSSNGWCWRCSQRILCESEESLQECLSLSSDGDTTLGDLEEIFGIDPKEVEGLHYGNSPNDSATQQPVSNAADFLRDHMALKRAHRELTLKARAGDLDPVLCARVEAMTRLLDLYLDKSLGLTWIKALEVVAKSEGCGTTRAWSIQQWVMNFMGT